VVVIRQLLEDTFFIFVAFSRSNQSWWNGLVYEREKAECLMATFQECINRAHWDQSSQSSHQEHFKAQQYAIKERENKANFLNVNTNLVSVGSLQNEGRRIGL
jgi:hypothetical protein